MKSKTYILLLLIGAACLQACEIDNYQAPDAQISGKILDHRGELLRTEPGKSSMRIQMDELSWAKGDTSIAIIPTHLNVKIDGTYVNTKVFSGTYRMTPIEGPFYPYGDGDTVHITKKASKDFIVTPYLDVNWVDPPHFTADSCIEASVAFQRNPKDGEFMPDLLNARLCISSNQYVGNNNHYSDLIAGAVPIANAQENTTITLKSKQLKYYNTHVYVRVGICCNDTYKKYNYTTIVKLDIP